MRLVVAALAMLGGAAMAAESSGQLPADFVSYHVAKGFKTNDSVKCPGKLRVRENDERFSLESAHEREGLRRCRPSPPVECLVRMGRQEVFDLQLRVGEDGRPDLVVVMGSSQDCADKYVAASAAATHYVEADSEANLAERITLKPTEKERVLYDPPLGFSFDAVNSCRWKLMPPPEDDESDDVERPKPIFRCPPEYPERCMRGLSRKAVLVLFDIEPSGLTANVRVVASTDPCLNKTAAKAVSSWRYEESANRWPDVDTHITFELYP